MGELSEIPPVPPPAQFDTRGGGGGGSCCTTTTTTTTSNPGDPTAHLRLNENVWVKNSCQTLPNTKFRQQQRAGK